MSDARPIVAVTLGDPAGIGPEVALKAYADADLRTGLRMLMVGSAAVLRRHAAAMDLALPPVAVVHAVPEAFDGDTLYVVDVAEGEGPRTPFGEITAAGGHLAMQSVERAVDFCQAGTVDAMVTAPISKAAIGRAGYEAPGHTEFIAARTRSPEATYEPLMMMVGQPSIGGGAEAASAALRVGLVSVHEPLAQVPRSVTASAIRRKLRILDASLRRDYGVTAPRIAVLGLNPHAGDGGALGDEEQRLIAPALDAARIEDGLAARGTQLDGPLPADGFFGTQGWHRCDAVLAMYHDQGLAPFKALTFGGGVNMTAGLPVVRTSPDHGTAFDIAGQGHAHPGSMKSALRLAATIAVRRTATPPKSPAADA